ncbi:hypothetical protein LIER_23825 [Lithospermum erythrorhizon]|uniref:Uncharacterized protein n=1 Tax=Lithospermum erythrorhizon TaxID=34254 RepID=A0AAV3R2T5_LITER
MYNMTEDIDDPVSPNFQKVTLRNFTFDFCPKSYKWKLCTSQWGQTGILEAQKVDILTAKDVKGPAPRFITISPKLMQGTHATHIPLRAVETRSGSGTGNEETARFLRDEVKHLDCMIQSSLARKLELEARLKSLTGKDDPAASESEAEADGKLYGYMSINTNP